MPPAKLATISGVVRTADGTVATSATVSLSQMRLLPSGTGGATSSTTRIGNTDVTDTPLDFNGSDIDGIEIELTDRLTEVSGVVLDGTGEGVPFATVVLFAEDRRRWGPHTRFVALVQSDASGAFRHRGLPPEQYVAAALHDLEPGEHRNPATLERLAAGATRVDLVEGEARTLTLAVP